MKPSPFSPCAWARRVAIGGATAITLLLAAGCNSVPQPIEPLTRSYEPTNVSGVAYLPVEVRRVAVLPAWSGQGLNDASFETIENAFRVALTRSARFEVIPVSTPDLREWTGQPRIGSAGRLPAHLFAALREQTGADAVLFIDITHYSPYPPLALGVRTRLVRLDDGSDLWAADELFDAALASASAGARRHQAQGASGPADLSPTILQSPARFAVYVADTLVETLPPR